MYLPSYPSTSKPLWVTKANFGELELLHGLGGQQAFRLGLAADARQVLVRRALRVADQRVVERHPRDAVVAVEHADARKRHLDSAVAAQLRVHVLDDSLHGDPRSVLRHAR